MPFSKLREDHELFNQLTENPPVWWRNLTADEDVWVDIRKDNYINVYYLSGSRVQIFQVT